MDIVLMVLALPVIPELPLPTPTEAPKVLARDLLNPNLITHSLAFTATPTTSALQLHPSLLPKALALLVTPVLPLLSPPEVLKAPRPKDLLSPNLTTATLTTDTVINFNGLAIVPLDFPVPFGVLEGKT